MIHLPPQNNVAAREHLPATGGSRTPRAPQKHECPATGPAVSSAAAHGQRLHALQQNLAQVPLGAVNLKQGCEIQQGEIARMLEKMSKLESQRRLAVADLESVRNERQGDIPKPRTQLMQYHT